MEEPGKGEGSIDASPPRQFSSVREMLLSAVLLPLATGQPQLSVVSK